MVGSELDRDLLWASWRRLCPEGKGILVGRLSRRVSDLTDVMEEWSGFRCDGMAVGGRSRDRVAVGGTLAVAPLSHESGRRWLGVCGMSDRRRRTGLPRADELLDRGCCDLLLLVLGCLRLLVCQSRDSDLDLGWTFSERTLCTCRDGRSTEGFLQPLFDRSRDFLRSLCVRSLCVRSVCARSNRLLLRSLAPPN